MALKTELDVTTWAKAQVEAFLRQQQRNEENFREVDWSRFEEECIKSCTQFAIAAPSLLQDYAKKEIVRYTRLVAIRENLVKP